MSDKTMICRCEDVTLHEVEEALARGYHDIESVKRYTGFGTGFCQGKQCVALCARLIRDRTGNAASVPFTARPPYNPVPLAHLAALLEEEEPE
jgi:NAD(P)H-nitrite reductase large subunit